MPPLSVCPNIGEFKVQEDFPLWNTPKPTMLAKPATIGDAMAL
jgi:hypothetical protein